jgi:tRNA threonylcarbamoyl adenosine modification protein YeaZ
VIALVIDTSSAAVTAGVVDLAANTGQRAGLQSPVQSPAQVTVLGEHVYVDARAHGELLALFVQRSLSDAKLTMTDLEAVIVGVGPGPFTGLRVGLVTAAAIADVLSIPAYPICSLDAIAAAAWPSFEAMKSTGPSDGGLLVATDARRKEVYWARYRGGDRVDGPAVNKPADVAVSAAAMVGAGAVLYAEPLGFPLLEPQDSRSFDFPLVSGLAAVAAPLVLGHGVAEPLTPLYLRRPDAIAAASHKSVSQA